jgi:hypothetical protein
METAIALNAVMIGASYSRSFLFRILFEHWRSHLLSAATASPSRFEVQGRWLVLVLVLVLLLAEVAGRAGRPVEARHHQHVALGEAREHTGELGAVGLRAARRFAVGFGATFGAELLELSVERLPVGADAGVSEVAILRATR